MADESLTLAGHSLGVILAAEYAARYRPRVMRGLAGLESI